MADLDFYSRDEEPMNDQAYERHWYDTIGMIGGWLFVACILLVLILLFLKIIFESAEDAKTRKVIDEAEADFQRPKPTSKEDRFFNDVEEAQNDFN